MVADNNKMKNSPNEPEDDRDDDQLSSSDGDTTDSKPSDLGKDTKDNKESTEPQLVQRESKHVFQLRALVLIVLLLAAVAVSAVVYKITRESENASFETQYKGTAQQVTDAFQGVVQEKLGAVSALGVAMIAHGIDHNEAWPFVTLSSFQERSRTAQSLSDTLFLGFAPYVTEEQRPQWETFVVNNDQWAEDAFDYQRQVGINDFLAETRPGDDEQRLYTNDTSYPIFYIDENGNRADDPGPGPYFPIWQTSPVLHRHMVNQDLARRTEANFNNTLQLAWDSKSIVIGRMEFSSPGDKDDPSYYTLFYSTVMSIFKNKQVDYVGDVMTTVFLPVFNSFNLERSPVAILFATVRWATYFENLLPPNVQGITLVVFNPCDGAYTYEIRGPEVIPVGRGDLHDRDFSNLGRTADLSHLTSIADGTEAGLPFHQDECLYSIHVYPSRAFYKAYHTNTPVVVTCAVAIIFVFTACMFMFYDRLVERRQQLVMRKAIQSTAIVSSLFPSTVRDRLLHDSAATGKGGALGIAPNTRLKSYLKGDSDDQELGMQPIADLFPHATVLFSDIAGFTAWSSTRDPAQVFILLQTVYQAFDVIAKKRNVFKVETIGDSYVAVTGLPEPQEKHALIMARFAGDCMEKMSQITKDLEVSLGPDTGDLSMRVGLHSGPVTAGVLRGERSRFQLFGDTVNTASRMESTGIAQRIQISQATADLLIEQGKEHWIKPREDAVEAKGKGVMKTYWLTPNARKAASTVSGGSADAEQVSTKSDAQIQKDEIAAAAAVKQERLVSWIVELLSDHLKQIIAKRRLMGGKDISPTDFVYRPENGVTALDESADVIRLPKFDPKTAVDGIGSTQGITIPADVSSKLHDYVATLASTYRDNPFHNFEHACHVTMAVNKFLKRITSPDIDVKKLTGDDGNVSSNQMASQLHHYTHGINSDPLTHFAIVLSALIHDADHRGISNVQLIKEDPKMGAMYKNKSVAEQNSLELSWDLFMSDQFELLRRSIFGDMTELRRFRQVLVNIVLATDIFDKELNDQRKARWNKAFAAPTAGTQQQSDEHNDLRATIVIEHIIQASDVSHTMQHWHIYRKWNVRLFTEMYRAYKAGRMGIDPSTFWYKGELGFFDNYIIPLAKKLKDCNVFGVSSDECLNYALKNRVEWEERGKEMVEQMMNDLNKET